jgi:putative transposase
MGLAVSTLRYTSCRPLQEALRTRLREVAATHVRYGYRRLTVLLRREGWKVNAKRVYRLYDQENLKVRSVERKKISRRQRLSHGPATGPNQCWSADFVRDKLTDGRSYRILTVIDQFTRECVAIEADRSLQGKHLVAALIRAIVERGQAPRSITLDLCFIRSGRPVENVFIESFNGRLRDECLNVEWFGSLHQARERLAQWHDHYNLYRPHSALDDQSPATFASSYQSPEVCFAPIGRNTASCGPRQGFASPAQNAALDPVPHLPENSRYRGEALFEIAHARGSLLSLWSQLQARQSSSGEP